MTDVIERKDFHILDADEYWRPSSEEMWQCREMDNGVSSVGCV